MNRLLIGSSAMIGCLVFSSIASLAQETKVWSDLDCAQSKLVVPAGVRCRATQEWAGSRTADIGGARGTHRQWAASGTVSGAKVWYFLTEALSPSSYQRATGARAGVT